MGKFRRSLSAPTGLTSSSSSSSPPSNNYETSSQPFDTIERIASGDVIPEESLAESSPSVPARSFEESSFVTPQSASSSTLTYSIHHRLMDSVVGKRSATSLSDSQTNQSYDSAFRSGSQDSELSISETPKPAGDACMLSISASSQPDSQESGVCDSSTYSLDAAVSTASPEFSSPCVIDPSRSIHIGKSMCTLPYDDVDGPLSSPPLSDSHSAFIENDTKHPIPYDISEGFSKSDTMDTERTVALPLDCVDGPSLPKNATDHIVEIKEKSKSYLIDGSPRKKPGSVKTDSVTTGKSNDNLGSVNEHSKKPDAPSTSKQYDLETPQRTKVSQAGECPFCLKQSSNAVLIHGKTGHQVCCYKCAKKLRRRGKPCPVCRKPIQKVIKNFII
jgi:E3 ubiquitin-protein ligase Mdm2